MEAKTCKRCGGREGESKEVHESVREPGDLDLIPYKGDLWHRTCADADKGTEADSKRIKRDIGRRARGR